MADEDEDTFTEEQCDEIFRHSNALARIVHKRALRYMEHNAKALEGDMMLAVLCGVIIRWVDVMEGAFTKAEITQNFRGAIIQGLTIAEEIDRGAEH